MIAKPVDKIAVIGAGAWGTALAEVLSRGGRRVMLYARDEGLAAAINTAHENPVYLPGHALDPLLVATAHLQAAADGADMVLMAVPAQHTRAMLETLAPHLPAGVPLVSCSKGIEISTGLLLSEVANDVVPRHPFAVLSGPTFAHEVARGMPCAITFATAAPGAQALHWAAALHSHSFKPYLSHDPAGVEVAGAIKNVLAVACGIVEGKGLGQNARAAVMTRGIAEIRRFMQHRGGRAETLLGLAGIGDLTLTCHSTSSRNFSLGLAVGRGQTLAEALAGKRSVAEGAATARAVSIVAEKKNIDMPICLGVDAILHGGVPVDLVIRDLLSRDIRDENE